MGFQLKYEIGYDVQSKFFKGNCSSTSNVYLKCVKILLNWDSSKFINFIF